MSFDTKKGKYAQFNKEILDRMVTETAADIARSLHDRYSSQMKINPASLANYIGALASEQLGALPRKVEVVQVPIDHTPKDQLRKILTNRQQDVHSLEKLSDQLDCGVSKVRGLIEELQRDGLVVSIKDDHVVTSRTIEKSPSLQLDVPKMTTGNYRFGVIGDNHMGSRYERLDVLNALYNVFAEEGITKVFNTGNWIDGEARFNKHDLHIHGMDNQLQYMIDKYPRMDGITTYYVAGDDHEGWYTQREGVNIGQMLEMKAQRQGRNDLVHLGYMEADIELAAPNGVTIIRVVHPGGGSAYATSYTMQKLVESYQGGEKPHVVLAGHYHKAEYLYYRGVHIIQSACTQDQTPFMRKKKLSAHLGGWIIEFGTDDYGAITRFKQEFIPFYDNNYYKKWIHKD